MSSGPFIDLDRFIDAMEAEGLDEQVLGAISYSDLVSITARYDAELKAEEQNGNGHIDPETVGLMLDEVRAERVEWLWPGYIARGKVTIVDGDPGNGKSALSTDLASRLTAGREWPDGQKGTLAGVVILNAEDGLADTIRPRVDAAAGDPSLMVAIDGVGQDNHPVVLPTDIPFIEAAIKRVEAGLVIIDPFMAFLAVDVRSHHDQDVRRVLRQLRDLAERTGAAIVVIRHLNKNSSGPALYRGGGSIGIIGAARIGLVVGVDPQDENRRILASSKANLTVKPPSVAYRLQTATNGSVRVEWEGITDMSADQLLAAPQVEDADTTTRIDEARRVLLELLAEGPMDSKLAMKAVREATGASDRTIWDAKKRAMVKANRVGGMGKAGSWVWSL